MQRVGLQRFARIFSSNMFESAGSGEIDGQRHEQHQKCRNTRLDMHGVEEEPVKRFINDVERGEEQQTGLDECGKVFEFSVAVGMAFVGRFIRDAHGEKRDDCRNQVQIRSAALRRGRPSCPCG